MLRTALVLLAAAWTLPAGAETYKWVDEHGVVNYSNNPPAAAKAGSKLVLVEDRVSTYQSDPALLRSAAARAAAPRPDYAEIEWLQRQRFMMERQAAQQAYADDCGYASDCRSAYLPAGYLPYYVPAPLVHRRATVRPTFFIPQRTSFQSRSRGSLMLR
jgi:hypothetical protein